MAAPYVPRVTARRAQPVSVRLSNGRTVSRALVNRVKARLANPSGSPGPILGSQQRPVAAPKPRPAAAAKPAAPPAPTLPALSAAVTPPPLPPDATYEQAVGLAARNRDDQIAGLAQQRVAGLLDYGYTEAPTPGGSLAFDPNNPFSRAALLRKHYQQAQAANTTSMAARGQLYAGALQDAQDYSTSQYRQSDDQLQKALASFLARNVQQRAQAVTGYDTQVSQAAADRLNRIAQNPLYDPAAESALPPPPAPAAKAAAAKPKPKVVVPRVTARRPQPVTVVRRPPTRRRK